MLTKQALARRIRDTRLKRKMTLKQVEKLSGFSSTHISEIERGRTSPTISALTRIAGALGKDTCYFTEDRELDEVCLTGSVFLARDPAARRPVEVHPLTEGVLTSRLRLFCLRASDTFEGTLDELGAGDFCFYMVAGPARIRSGQATFALEPGSSLHAHFETPPVIAFAGGRAEMIVAVDPQPGDDGRGRPEPLDD